MQKLNRKQTHDKLVCGFVEISLVVIGHKTTNILEIFQVLLVLSEFHSKIH